MPWQDLMQKLIGDQKAKGDEITPEGSPIDLVAGGIGSSLGRGMMAAAPAVVGNEVGAIGSNVIPKAGQYAADVTAGAPVSEGAVNQLIGTPESIEAAKQVANRAVNLSPYSVDAIRKTQALNRTIELGNRFNTLKSKLGR